MASTKQGSGGGICCQERCSLCKERLRGYHSHPEQWKGELQQFFLQYTDISDVHACVCKADELSLRNGLKGNYKGKFTPRWVKREQKKKKPCCVPGCVVEYERTCGFVSFETVCVACGVTVPTTSGSGDAIPVLLCAQHHRAVHRYCNPSKDIECAICGIKRKHRASTDTSFRPVPQPECIEVLLKEVGNFEKSLSEDSMICPACNIFCRRALSQHDDLRPAESIVKALREKVDELKEKLTQCKKINDFSLRSDFAFLSTAVYVGDLMLCDKAVTFPKLYQKYCSFISDSPMPRYRVLVYIGREFGDLMSSVCHSKRIGRIFYRTKCDPLVMLSNALGTAKTDLDCSEEDVSMSQMLRAVADYLNRKIMQLAKTLIASRKENPIAACSFDLEEFISHVDPELWDTFSRLTQSSNEKLGRFQSDPHLHVNRVRLAYLLCVVLFCASSGHCSVPLHIVLADFVDASGGSSELISVLNRLGALASADTLDRHICAVSVQRKMEGLLNELNDESLTVACTDNVDIAKSHAAVYSGTQHRSWHGTSVQVVQPQPRRLKVVPANLDGDIEVTPAFLPTTAFCSTSSGDPGGVNKDHPVAPPIPVSAYLKYRQCLRAKRATRYSPINSPSKLTRSPSAKRLRLARTFQEAVGLGEIDSCDLSTAEVLSVGARSSSQPTNLQLCDFLQSEEEASALGSVKRTVFTYLLQKSSLSPEHVMFSIKDHVAAMKGDIPTEQSVVVYLSIIDMNADTLEAMSEVAAMLHEEYLKNSPAEHLVVVGDAKTYLRLKELKQHYGSELEWLIPFIGDWHVLHNYHETLMKVYYDAGLKELAMASGFRAQTLTSLGKASNFKRTHAFLMQVWEAFYRHFLDQYKAHSQTGMFSCQSSSDLGSATMFQKVRDMLLLCNDKCVEEQKFDKYVQYTQAMNSDYEYMYEDFSKFLERLCGLDDNWKFWHNFVFHDMLAYVGLYLAIRGGLWDLRMASLKKMCPVFTAFDRLNYLKILPTHFDEVMSMPEQIRHCFEQGGFVCNIKGNKFSAVALDEAHEMLVNKDIKTTVVRPSPEYLNRIMYYYPVRAQSFKVLKEQLFPPTQKGMTEIIDTSPHGARCEENIVCMISKLCDSKVLDVVSKNRGLCSIGGVVATPEQQKDLLAFRDVGQEYHNAYITYFILKDRSVSAPLRLRRLHTFSTHKKAQKKIKQKEKEQNLVSRCIRRQLAWSAQTQTVQHKGEQYLELPRALCTHDACPHKGQKSYATKFLEKRYSNLVVSMLPEGWVPDSVVLEGMFLINTVPLVTHTTMKDYARFTLSRFAVPHFVKGAKEVHIVFDNPGCIPHTPKAFEQSRRDTDHPISPDHQHYEFSDSARVPQKWRDHLNCRHCKRQLVLYLGQAYLRLAPELLRDEQMLVIAGCFQGEHLNNALGITVSSVMVCPLLASNAEESDTRVWLHAFNSTGSKKLLFSPDTDVYHIGLPLLKPDLHDVYVQLSPVSSLEVRLLHVNELHRALASDSDLSLVPSSLLACVLQTLFICSGCDYISFFAGIGKATMMRRFFENAWFITGTSSLPGTLADTDHSSMDKGFLAFIRLIGTVYFKKHLSAFIHDTPRALYYSLTGDNITPFQQHSKFLETIRDTVWDRIQFEDELPPSVDSLWRHWQRTCWVSHMWGQADQSHMTILDVTRYGWKLSERKLEFDWESDENRVAVQNRIGLLFRGCSCASVTACVNRRCGCVKKGSKCGPGCRCKNCGNVDSATPGTQRQNIVSEMHEVEEEELLSESLLRDVHGDQMVQEEDDEDDNDDMVVFSGESDEEEDDAEDEDDGGPSITEG